MTSLTTEPKLSELCNTTFKTIESNQLLYNAIKVMFLDNVNSIIVTDKNEKPLGYIAQDDILKLWKQKFFNDFTV